MATALTAYLTCSNASGTLATASNIVAALGGANSSTSTTVGTSTGYGELWSLGTATAWGAGGSSPAPSGNGFLYDVTTLEANQFIAGNWTSNIRLQMATAAQSLTADIICRWYMRSSGGIYTAIGSSTLTAQNITNTATTFALPLQNLAQTTGIAVGSKLYVDLLLNITASTGTTGVSQCKIVGPHTSAGVATLELVTPGYQFANIIWNVADSQTLSDTLSLAFAPTDADTLSSSDAFTGAMTATALDVLTASDLVSGSMVSSSADSLNSSDAQASSIVASGADVLSLADVWTLILAFAGNNSVTLSDAWAGAFAVSVADSLTLRDALLAVTTTLTIGASATVSGPSLGITRLIGGPGGAITISGPSIRGISTGQGG